MVDKIEDLYARARHATRECENEKAYRYYKEIQKIDANNWEANFMIIYFEAINTPANNIWAASVAVLNIENKIFCAIRDEIKEEDKEKAIKSVCDGLSQIADKFTKDAKNKFDKTYESIKSDFISEYVNNLTVAAEIMYLCGDSLNSTFKEDYISDVITAWKKAIDINTMYIKFVSNRNEIENTIKKYTTKIQKYDPGYKAPHVDLSESDEKGFTFKIKRLFGRISS